MRKRGWFKESFRHMLSAKGVKTSRRKARTKKDTFKWQYQKMFLAAKGVKYYEPDLEQREGVAPFEAITGLKEPEFIRRLLPEIPKKARLTKREAAERIKEEQAQIAAESDIAAKKLMEGKDVEAELRDVEEAQRVQALARRGMEEQFIGGRPLTRAQREMLAAEREAVRKAGVKRYGLE